MPSGLLRSCSSVVWGVAATVYTVSSARMRMAAPSARALAIARFRPVHLPGIGRLRQGGNDLGADGFPGCPLEPGCSSVPFSHSLALAVAGSLAASIEYSR